MPPLAIVIINTPTVISITEWSTPCLSVPSENLPIIKPAKNPWIKINAKNTPEKVAKIIQKMGSKNVVITGIVKKNNQISDFVLEKNNRYFISGDRISKINHGSGCNFSSALTVGIGSGKSLDVAVKFAKKYTYNSIKNAKQIGKGIPITYSISNSDKNKKILENAINDFINSPRSSKSPGVNRKSSPTVFLSSSTSCGNGTGTIGVSGTPSPSVSALSCICGTTLKTPFSEYKDSPPPRLSVRSRASLNPVPLLSFTSKLRLSRLA
ncbi:MAG: bifunctional hydroxymethylpyrimidine kinase/phosphomethylpyrimidine kinase [Candidatus Dadabacteria bacterium]|nr:bifunctional hydroxymethylpyrimidine kinase/phosphomethylpyrimidine kinase [Candidatus Dadabacteria bacterium]